MTSDPGSARRAQIVAAASSVFRRYGFARTTMGDIAQAAGLSRPTLYAAFPDKPSIFEAVIADLVDTELGRIRAGNRRRAGLPAQLRYACSQWMTTGFEIISANPEASDLFDDRFPAVQAGNAAFQALLVELLDPAVPGSGLGLAALDLARMMTSAMQGFKRTASTKAELDRLLETCVRVTLAAVAHDDQAAHRGPIR
jgi:AcrR family transcriptional regulator